MKASRVIGCALLLGLIILIWQTTTFLSVTALPRGVIINWHVESAIVSGEVVKPLELLSAHHTPARFVAAGETVILHPIGFMPYHEQVIGSRYRFAVNSPSIGTKTIYLIDGNTSSMTPISNGNFDIKGVGDGIGSTLAHTKDKGRLLGDKQAITITHENIYEIVELLIDLRSNAVVSVQVSRKAAVKLPE